VPRLAGSLSWRDRMGTLRARLGILRHRYRVNPGLYCVGEPTPDSPVLVTANYKLSFDSLRRELAGLDLFILVVDTRGINVWCAAGKGTFSAAEVALQVERSRLAERVNHRRLVLPQLAAPGVAAHELPGRCGFSGLFGPVRARDVRAFLERGMTCDEPMRSVSFTLAERLVLVPVELVLGARQFAVALGILLLLAGWGPGWFSSARLLDRWPSAAASTVAGLLAGSVLVPALLPWLPGRQFWVKGVIAGAAVLATAAAFSSHLSFASTGLGLWLVAVSSYAGMNFTGATPFTSLSGVKKELPRGLGVQISLAASGLCLWMLAPFLTGGGG